MTVHLEGPDRNIGADLVASEATAPPATVLFDKTVE